MIVGNIEGYTSFGHQFYCTVYKTLIDFSSINEITEIVWCGPEDDYETATDGYGTGFTRYAITSQVHKQLN